jgi:SAM-dependent methyltransferase
MYRQHVQKKVEAYDIRGAAMFSLLAFLGLREFHYVLDVACGSLRAGRLLIPYLLPGRYFGTEVFDVKPIIDEAVEGELGAGIKMLKWPQFCFDEGFNLSDCFPDVKFDYILAQGILQYMGKPYMTKLFSEAKKVMAPGAMMVATFWRGENYDGDEFTYPALQRHRPEFIQGIANDAGLVLYLINWPYPRYTWILLRQAEDPVMADRDIFHDFKVLVETLD